MKSNKINFFISKKKKKHSALFKNNHLKTHTMIIGTTGTGMSLKESEDIFSYFDLKTEYIDYFKNFIDILYQAKDEFIKNPALQVIKFYGNKNRYDFIAENVTDFYYTKDEFYHFISATFKSLSFIQLKNNDNDISFFLNEELVDKNLNYMIKYFKKQTKIFPNKLKCQEYLNLKVKEKEVQHFENILSKELKSTNSQKIKL